MQKKSFSHKTSCNSILGQTKETFIEKVLPHTNHENIIGTLPN